MNNLSLAVTPWSVLSAGVLTGKYNKEEMYKIVRNGYDNYPGVKSIVKNKNDCFGNPSALHIVGQDALEHVNIAKQQVANAIGAPTENVHFCSGATEANNIILKGFWLNHTKSFKHDIQLVTSPTEHGSIIECAKYINKFNNVRLRWVRVNGDGTIDLSDLENILKEKRKSLVSIMWANNEIGTISDIEKISHLCDKYGAWFHTDATQALGKIDINVSNVDALSISAHKIYGPKGIGAVYISSELSQYIDPLLDGGYQNTFSSGTQNVPGIIGMGKACELLPPQHELIHIRDLRDLLLYKLKMQLGDHIVQINGSMKNRLDNNLNISFKGVPAEVLILGMTDVIVSGGSACKSGGHKVSHVLQAIKSENSECAIRFGLGKWNTSQDIEYAVERIVKVVRSVRSKK